MATKKTRKVKKNKRTDIEWYPSDKGQGYQDLQAVRESIVHDLQEVLSIAARRKLAQRMIKLARKMEVARARARARFAPGRNLKLRGQKLARQIFRTRIAGERGRNYKNLGMGDKIAVDKQISKHGKAIKKMVARLMPAVKRAEGVRLSKVRHASADKNDMRHRKKFSGRGKK